ncbi:hypothetical protein Bbelb_070600 [Branchiostoma belcheri]|nr:hypothetical protein Bbelb_070600 [Branchiostoma belcheri]
MEEETDGSPVLSIDSTSRDLQTAYLIISLVLSVGCGLLLMFLVWKKEYLQKPSHYLRCNLAVDDIVFTGCLIPVQINALFRQDASGEQLWCSAEVLVGPACLLSMFGTYVMMAVDLYYFVCDPLHYHDKVTTKRVLLGILAFRTLSLVGGLGPVVFGGLPKYNLRCEIDAANSTSVSAILRSTNVLFAILVALSVFIIYCRVFLEAKRQQERDENRSLWVFQTKAFKVMVPHAIVLTASLTTTIFRIATLRAVISEEQMSQRALIVAARVALLLYLTLSSVANPVIYSLRLPEFRRACKELCGWPTNLNPPAVPARRHRQDEVEMATIPGPRRRVPASELAPAQTSSEGTITQLTEEIMPSDQARKQTTQASPDQRLEQGTVTESASGRPLRRTMIMSEVQTEPSQRPKEEHKPVTLPGQLQTDD